MNRGGRLTVIGATIFVLMAPAIHADSVAERGGLTSLEGVDLIVTSLTVSLVAAGLLDALLIHELPHVRRRADAWLGAFCGLVLLVFVNTVLLVLVLVILAEDDASPESHGLVFPLMWGAAEAVAVLISSTVGWRVLEWLEHEEGAEHGVARIRRFHKRGQRRPQPEREETSPEPVTSDSS